MRQGGVSGEFIDSAKGPLFVLLREPPTVAKGCVLIVPPFAEEMNKCRRMVTETALGLAARGFATILPDLYGTGDSGGDFSDGDLDTWRYDLACASRWSARRGHLITGLLAMRLGCALAAAGLRAGDIPSVARTALWQPIFDGERYLRQFLRLRLAASMTGDDKLTAGDIRERLGRGEVVEVAGYRLSSRLASELASLASPPSMPEGFGDVRWFEVVHDASLSLPILSSQLIERSRIEGRHVEATVLQGEPYWSATETISNGMIVRATVEHLAFKSPIGNTE